MKVCLILLEHLLWMMPLVSSGILMYRIRGGLTEVFLVHPGGPFFRNKDEGVWSIPKGEPEAGEQLEKGALREFKEETGIAIHGKLIPLGSVRQKGGKTVHAWATVGDWPEEFAFKSNLFELEWPPHSGKIAQFPEMDKAGFFSLEAAKTKINQAQVALIERLEEHLAK